jgi:hypothetical protein
MLGGVPVCRQTLNPRSRNRLLARLALKNPYTPSELRNSIPQFDLVSPPMVRCLHPALT